MLTGFNIVMSFYWITFKNNHDIADTVNSIEWTYTVLINYRVPWTGIFFFFASLQNKSKWPDLAFYFYYRDFLKRGTPGFFN